MLRRRWPISHGIIEAAASVMEAAVLLYVMLGAGNSGEYGRCCIPGNLYWTFPAEMMYN